MEPFTTWEVVGIDFGSQFACKFVELTFAGACVHISCDKGYEPLSISKADFGSGKKFGDVSPPLTLDSPTSNWVRQLEPLTT